MKKGPSLFLIENRKVIWIFFHVLHFDKRENFLSIVTFSRAVSETKPSIIEKKMKNEPTKCSMPEITLRLSISSGTLAQWTVCIFRQTKISFHAITTSHFFGAVHLSRISSRQKTTSMPVVYFQRSTNLWWKIHWNQFSLFCLVYFYFFRYAGNFFVVVNKKAANTISFDSFLLFFPNEKDKTETPLSLFCVFLSCSLHSFCCCAKRNQTWQQQQPNKQYTNRTKYNGLNLDHNPKIKQVFLFGKSNS